MKSNLKVKESPQSTPSQKKKYWKKEITDAWQTSVKSIIRVGEILIASKEDLEYGYFSKMIENELPFGCRVAQTLMKIASDDRITDTRHASVLPNSYSTLEELIKLDDVSFHKGIKSGEIHAGIQRREAVFLRKKSKWKLTKMRIKPFVRTKNTKLKIWNECGIEGSKKRIEDNSIDLCLTDPPYGINVGNDDKKYIRASDRVLDGYVDIPPEEYEKFCNDFLKQTYRVLRAGGSAYVCSGWKNLEYILSGGRNAGLIQRSHIVWKYDFGLNATNKWINSTTHIIYFVKPPIGNLTFNTISDDGMEISYHDKEDLWSIPREPHRPYAIRNSNQLPHALVEKMISYSSQKGDKVLDFFMGGFTTAKCSLKLQREPIGFEKNKNSFNYFMNELDNQ